MQKYQSLRKFRRTRYGPVLSSAGDRMLQLGVCASVSGYANILFNKLLDLSFAAKGRLLQKGILLLIHPRAGQCSYTDGRNEVKNQQCGDRKQDKGRRKSFGLFPKLCFFHVHSLLLCSIFI